MYEVSTVSFYDKIDAAGNYNKKPKLFQSESSVFKQSCHFCGETYFLSLIRCFFHLYMTPNSRRKFLEQI